MFVILTSKPGQYRSEPGDGFAPREAWDYLSCGSLRARFLIAELQGPARVRIVEEGAGGSVNSVPAKFLPTFKTVEAARADLESLTRLGDIEASLVRQPLPGEAPVQPAAAPDKVHVTFVNNGEKRVSAPHNSNLLRVSLREQGGIPFKCGGGVCGTCKCRIVLGVENTDAVKPKERKHLSDEQLAQGYRMACQTFVRGDVAVTW